MNATAVLKIDPATDQVSNIGELDPGGFKWHGGVTAPNGCIYGIPSHSDSVLKIDPMKGVVQCIKAPVVPVSIRDGRYKYLGGVLGCDGNIYAMPANAEAVLQINTHDDTVHLIGGPFVGENKWQNGYLAPDNCIYGIPLRGESVLKISLKPGDVQASTVGGPLVGTDKWEGGVEGPDGALYCMPLRAKSVLKIAPHLQCEADDADSTHMPIITSAPDAVDAFEEAEAAIANEMLSGASATANGDEAQEKSNLTLDPDRCTSNHASLDGHSDLNYKLLQARAGDLKRHRRQAREEADIRALDRWVSRGLSEGLYCAISKPSLYKNM